MPGSGWILQCSDPPIFPTGSDRFTAQALSRTVKRWFGDAHDKGDADGRNVAAIAQFGILPDGRVEWGIDTAFPPLSVTREEVVPVPSHPGTFSLRVTFQRKR